MLKKYDQFSINEQTIKSTLGRNPADFEWEFLKHVYYSRYLNNPIPGINNIINHGGNYLRIDESTQLAVGMESKGSIISTSTTKACTALGIKPRLKYKSKQSKISFGITQNNTHQNPIITGREELLFLQDNKVLVSACADITVLDSIIVKHINPASLGYGINLISNNKYGMDIYLSSATQISIFSDKNIHGLLILVDQYLSGKIKGICKKHKQPCLHLGNLKKIQFMSISVRKKTKANIPLSSLNITEPPKISIIPTIPKSVKKDKHKTFKELKNYSSQVLELCKIVKKQKWDVFKPQKHAVDSFSLIPGNNDFAVSIPDNIHLLNKDIKTSNRIAISNAARQLVCKGYKPISTALILHGGNMQENNNQWNMREIFMGVIEAAQLMGLEIFRPIMTCDNKNYPGLELCVVGKRINESIVINESFISENDFITMLGSHRGELNSSQYQGNIQKQESNTIPVVDLRMETRLQETVLQGIQSGLIKSAVNVSNGGLAVSLVKSLQNAEKDIGARIHLSRKLRQDEMLFGETQGMVIVSIGEKDLMEFERICMNIGVPSTTIGRVTGDNRLKFNNVVKLDVNKL